MFLVKGNPIYSTGIVFVLTFASLLFLPVISAAYGLRDDQHPSVVHLEITGDPRVVTGCCPRCSGVLISLKHVATVATCLWGMTNGQPNPQDIQVYAGTSEVSGRLFNGDRIQLGYGACSRSVQLARAYDVIYHPQFSPQFHHIRHDVAIVVIPVLQATRFVQPIPMSFDMFDDGIGVSRECKIVGFGILNFPRGGYYNLLTWLQPLTRWEREVTVTNGCMGKPRDWSKKKWTAMVEGGLCSKVYSSEPRVCWNDKGAALICNGKLAGLVQGQYEDGGKLDMGLRQCSDNNTAGTGKISRQQIIFYNVKHLAELIPPTMDGSRDLEWTEGDNDTRSRDLAWALKMNARATTILDAIIPPDFASTTTASTTNSSISRNPAEESSINLSLEATKRQPNEQLMSSAKPIETMITDEPPTNERGNTGAENLMAFEDLPELEMDFVTNGEKSSGEVNVDDTVNENNPFNASWSHIHQLAIVLNQHFHTACTGVFIAPQSILTGASCLVRKEENYLPLGVANYRIITGHSNGMVDFCSDRIRTYAVRNVTLLNHGLRQPWQLYRKSRIAPYTEIYNLAVLTIAGTHRGNLSYPVVDDNTWRIPANLQSEISSQVKSSSRKENEDDSGRTLQCRMFSYGHAEFPYTNQKDRIGIKYLELNITENCSRPFYDFPFGEETENLWIKTESPHFLCTVGSSPHFEPSAGSIGAPLYCGSENKLIGLYIGRYDNKSFDSYLGAKNESFNAHIGPESHTHVFLKLADYEEWISDVLLDERYVQMRWARLNQATPMRGLDLVYMCVLVVMPRLLGWFARV